MPEKTISICDRCGKGRFYSSSYQEAVGLTNDGPCGYAARIVYNEKEGKGFGSPQVIILCRTCLDKVLPIIKETL